MGWASPLLHLLPYMARGTRTPLSYSHLVATRSRSPSRAPSRQAAAKLDLKIPVVVRLQGTMVDEAKALIATSRMDIISTDDLDDAAMKACQISEMTKLAKAAGLDISVKSAKVCRATLVYSWTSSRVFLERLLALCLPQPPRAHRQMERHARTRARRPICSFAVPILIEC